MKRNLFDRVMDRIAIPLLIIALLILGFGYIFHDCDTTIVYYTEPNLTIQTQQCLNMCVQTFTNSNDNLQNCLEACKNTCQS